MSKRTLNPRLAKRHRTYSIHDVTCLFGVHKNTVRQWIRQGLPLIDDQRPQLILGEALQEYLGRRRLAGKRPCKPGEIYCVRCRSPKRPDLEMAEYLALTPTSGNLIGFCPACKGLMYRRVSFLKLTAVAGGLEVTVRPARQHIAESGKPSVNCDLDSEEAINEKAQR